VLKALLPRLAEHARERGESPAEALSALQLSAAQIRRLSQQVIGDGIRDDLDLVSELLLEVEISMVRSERRWTRLTYDLHDGALQEVTAMRLELSAFRSQLQKGREGQPGVDHMIEFTDELDARLHSLDGSLRELIESFETPALADQPFEEAVHELVRTFEADTGIPTTIDLKGPFQTLTRSQRIALSRILTEAMINIRRHSNAKEVWIRARVHSGQAHLRIRDNGHGFDAKRTRAQAARHGHLGLAGMTERTRLLGGQLTIDSKPGGPTTITASLPAGPVQEHPRRVTRSSHRRE
jgi:two-component system nitrate/nitrite sensor histidine kinase NarX